MSAYHKENPHISGSPQYILINRTLKKNYVFIEALNSF